MTFSFRLTKVLVLLYSCNYALYAMNSEGTQGIPLVSCTLKEIVSPQKIYSRLIEKFTVLSTDTEASDEDLEEGFIALDNETNDLINKALLEKNYENSSFLFDFITQVKQQQISLQNRKNESAQDDFFSAYRKLSSDFYNLRSNKKLSNEEILKQLSHLNDTLTGLDTTIRAEAPQSILFSNLQKDVATALEEISKPFSLQKPFLIECGSEYMIIDPATIDMEAID